MKEDDKLTGASDIRHHPPNAIRRVKVGDFVKLKGAGNDARNFGFVLKLDKGVVTLRQSTGAIIKVQEDNIELIEDRGPLELLSDGRFSTDQDYALRLQAAYLQHAYKYDPLSGLSNARIEPKLHQVFVAHRVTHKLYHRMILADEVGLGKTIEAGLIIKELRARQIAQRVLVLCPASLQQQWEFELTSKFNEEFEIIDGLAIKHLGKGGANPWKKQNGVITSLNLARMPEHAKRIVNAGWDMVVIDEAHRAKKTAKQTYKLADNLKDISNGLLLLTATPMQLHPEEMHSLIELIDPDLYLDVDEYERRLLQIPTLNTLITLLLNWSTLSLPDKRSKLPEIAKGFSVFSQKYQYIKLDNLDNADFRNELINDIFDKHPVAQVMVRNRKSQLGEAHIREPYRVPIVLTEEEQSLYEDVTDYIRRGYDRAVGKRNNAVGFLMTLYQKILTSSSRALLASFKKRITKLQDDKDKVIPTTNGDIEQILEADDTMHEVEQIDGMAIDQEEIELEISQLEYFVNRLDSISDSKADVLVNDIVGHILDENSDEKILIFTQFIKTQEFLYDKLSTRYKVAIFNGQMNLTQKEQEVKRFKYSVPIMITTEAGGEGRNFQFAHIMINYDLPWNPMKIEQRIGRLDRIGQNYPVQIYNLYNEDTIEEHILNVLEKRIDLFTKSVGSLDPILGNVEREIRDIVIKHTDDEAIKQYGIDLEGRVKRARLKEETMADFILDRASFNEHEANDLLKRSVWASFDDLSSFISNALDYYGGGLVPHVEGGFSLDLSSRLATRAGIRQVSTQGVFDPNEALEREDLDFFAFGHEIIDKIVSYVSNKGSLAGVRYVPDATLGTLLEVVYSFEGSSRINPIGKMIRHLVGENLQVRRQSLERLPEIGMAVGGAEKIMIPDWLSNAIEASTKQASKDLKRISKQLQNQDRQTREEKKLRISRVYQHRRQQLITLINNKKKAIDEMESNDSENPILHVWRDELDKQETEFAGLDHKYQLEVVKIDQETNIVLQTVVCAGLVIGK